MCSHSIVPLALSAVLAFVPPLCPQGIATAQSATHAVITGVVTAADGVPLEGALASIPRAHRRCLTDAEGRFRFDVRPGAYTLVISRLGYTPHSQAVAVRVGASLDLTVALEASPIELPPVVVTATSRTTASPLTTAADVEALGGYEKEVTQTASLGATLEGLPGVTNISTGCAAGKPVIHGLSGNRIRVLNQGIGMDYQQYGARHSPPVDPHLVDRIEVVRGAASVLYGSDALGGVVNLIPRGIPTTEDGAGYLSGHLEGGLQSNNRQASGSLHLEGATRGWGWTAAVVRRSAGNMHAPDAPTSLQTGSHTDPRFTGELPFTDFDQTTSSLGFGYRRGGHFLGVRYFRWRDQRNFLLPGGGGVGQSLSDDAVQMRGSFLAGDAWALRPVLSLQSNLRLANSPGSPRSRLPQDVAVDLLVRTITARVEAEHQNLVGLSGRVGIEYFRKDQDTRGVVPLHPSAQVDNVSVFALEGARMGALSVEIGARLDLRRQEAKPNPALLLPDPGAGESAEELTQKYTVASGAVGLSYRVGRHLAVTANAGRGFRAPSIFELHAYGVHGGVAAFQIGDPTLDAETSLNTDVSVRWHGPKLHAKVTAYRNVISDYVYLANTGEIEPISGLPIHRTIQEDAVLWGSDLSLQAQVLPWLQVTGVVEAVEGATRHTDLTLPLLPALQSRVGVVVTPGSIGPAEGVHLLLTVRRAEKQDAAGPYEPFWQYDQNPDFGVASTPSYTLLDAGLSLSIPVDGRPVTLHVGATNLTDRAYRDFLDTYKGYALGMGRNVSIKVSVSIGGRR